MVLVSCQRYSLQKTKLESNRSACCFNYIPSFSVYIPTFRSAFALPLKTSMLAMMSFSLGSIVNNDLVDPAYVSTLRQTTGMRGLLFG